MPVLAQTVAIALATTKIIVRTAQSVASTAILEQIQLSQSVPCNARKEFFILVSTVKL